jgi:DMSO reductase anchor subunit
MVFFTVWSGMTMGLCFWLLERKKGRKEEREKEGMREK